jgi:hypothetical protein
MRHLKKLGKVWVYLTHPLGYDPYDNYATSYMVNTTEHELLKVKREIEEAWIGNAELRTQVATAGAYEAQVAPFNGDPLL